MLAIFRQLCPPAFTIDLAALVASGRLSFTHSEDLMRQIRPLPFAIACLVGAMLMAGCTPQLTAGLKTAVDQGELVYTSTTQATADAKAKLATMPTNAPGVAAAAQKVIADSVTAESIARVALDTANAALKAAQASPGSDAQIAAINETLGTVLRQIPSPYTPIIAAIAPVLVTAVGYGLHSLSLNKTNKTLATATDTLKQQGAALDALNASTPPAVPVGAKPTG